MSSFVRGRLTPLLVMDASACSADDGVLKLDRYGLSRTKVVLRECVA
ncbi:MAG TPA: hypothetical protein VF342_06435 [Alphaproteobacteria bacterium]